MPGSTFGTLLRLHTFGESHGEAVGGIIDGFPAGFRPDFEAVQLQLNRRKPGQSNITTPRKEDDKLEILSGLFEGLTTGAPIAFIVRNKNANPADYEHLRDVYRPSHADFTWQSKFGIRDHRGGGRSSARETLSRVVAGALAEQWLATYGISVTAWVSAVGPIQMPDDIQVLNRQQIDAYSVRCPHEDTANKMIELIEELRHDGDSTGGVITAQILGLPAGLGEPVFDKFHAELGKAILSINAVKGFEIGSGFSGSSLRGSQHNDAFVASAEGEIETAANNSGGVQGGITNGAPVYFRAAFKPVASIARPQDTVNKQGEHEVISIHGRHDPCVVPRAVPIVEAMAALVAADFLLRSNAINNTLKG
ncbi:MAG: chorismate synthase [Bacteroidia bacterium]